MCGGRAITPPRRGRPGSWWALHRGAADVTHVTPCHAHQAGPMLIWFLLHACTMLIRCLFHAPFIVGLRMDWSGRRRLIVRA